MPEKKTATTAKKAAPKKKSTPVKKAEPAKHVTPPVVEYTPTPVVIPATPTVEAESPVTMSETHTSTADRKSGKSTLFIGAVLAVILLGGAATTVAAAKSLGKNTPFSRLTSFIPVEKISFLKQFTKPDEEIIRDAFVQEIDIDSAKRYNGREVANSFKIEMAAEQPDTGLMMSGNFELKGKAAVDKNGEASKAEYTYGGKFNTGVFTVDLGDDGIKMDVLTANQNEVYAAFHLSPKVKETAKPFLANYLGIGNVRGQAQKAPDIDQYLDKYYYLNIDEYYKVLDKNVQKTNELYKEMGLEEQPSFVPRDAQKVQEAAKKMIRNMQPDMQKLVADTYGRLNEYSTITSLPRQMVNGQSALVYQIDVHTDKTGKVTADFADGFLDLIKNHRGDIEEYCREMMSNDEQRARCSTLFDEFMKSNLNVDDSQKEEMTKKINEAVSKYISLKDVKVFVNPVDNSLLKVEGRLVINHDALKEKMKATDMQPTKLEFFYSQEEVSRGKELKLEIPKETVNFSEKFGEWMDKNLEEQRQMMRFYRQPANRRVPPTPVY